MQRIRSILMLSALSVVCLAATACVAVPVRGRAVYRDGPVCVPGHWQAGHWVRRHCR